ncbi:exodeoxyribonuclease VII small subunit [Luxibacter massiliensis]|uniref:exodeoxyribonuclease VII small subunit n=1 Tax=Luxibacter massiliensis TaxID=2219695 RepID=UPI000F06A50D|nr:exodeoxyribonuclease VII small subunit [Luxibacter massiliensis]
MAVNTNKQGQQEEERPSLEELFSGLDKVIARMEGEDITLEESFSLYQNGMDMLRQCSETIDAVEKKVQILDEDGEEHDF